MYARIIDPRYLPAVIDMLYGDNQRGLTFGEYERRYRRILQTVTLPTKFVTMLERQAVEAAYQQYNQRSVIR